jgi:glutaredoxin-related protein
VPALEALLDRFRAAHTQVLGVSVDSLYSHANWARDLGGISFPLLSDFEPKGAVARAYGLYLEDAGITDRATVLIDASGVVHHASSAGPGGERDIGDLASLAEHLDADYSGAREAFADGPGVDGAVLYVRDSCGFSRAARLAIENLRLADVEIRNVTRDPKALQALRDLSGAETAPCLVIDGEVVKESSVIVACLADRASPVG